MLDIFFKHSYTNNDRKNIMKTKMIVKKKKSISFHIYNTVIISRYVSILCRMSEIIVNYVSFQKKKKKDVK